MDATHGIDTPNWYHFHTSMKSVHIRDLPEVTLEGLKRRAARHHRSLQKEIHAVLEEAAKMAPIEEIASPRLGLHLVNTGRDDAWDRNAFYEDGESGR